MQCGKEGLRRLTAIRSLAGFTVVNKQNRSRTDAAGTYHASEILTDKVCDKLISGIVLGYALVLEYLVTDTCDYFKRQIFGEDERVVTVE